MQLARQTIAHLARDTGLPASEIGKPPPGVPDDEERDHLAADVHLDPAELGGETAFEQARSVAVTRAGAD